MSGVRISNLPPITNAQLTDIFPVVQAGITSKESLQQVLTLFGNYLALLSGATFTGPVFVPEVTFEVGDPTSEQVIPYVAVQTIASGAGGSKEHVLAATADGEILNATYAPGVISGHPGIGATLISNVNASFEADGIPFPAIGLRVLVRQQSALVQNGIYIVTQLGVPGVGGSPYVLTRSTDYDDSPTGQVLNGCLVYINSGITLSDSLAIVFNNSIDAYVLIPGVDDLSYFIFTGSGGGNPTHAGFATLVSGAATVAYPMMDDHSGVLLTAQQVVGTQGILSSPTQTAGVGFTIASSNPADNSVVCWEVTPATPLPIVKGSVSLVAGNAIVMTSAITASSVVILTIRNPISSNGKIIVASRIPGTSFSITSGYGADTSLIDWAIYDTGSLQANAFVTLSGGSSTVSYPALGASDVVLITVQSPVGTLGDLSVTSKVGGTGFQIVSNSPLDTSVIGWVIYPGASSTPHGLVTLVGGTVTVTNGSVATGSIILISSQNPSLSFGNFAIGTVTGGVSFVINSNSPIDTSQIGYIILN